MQGVVKPAFHAYRFLRQLTKSEIFRGEGIVATRTDAGHVRAVLYHHPTEYAEAPPLAFALEDAWKTLRTGSSRTVSLEISELPPGAPYLVESVDAEHAFAFRHWQEMGSPCSPSRFQTAQLRDFGWATRREIVQVDERGILKLELKLQPWASVLIREME